VTYNGVDVTDVHRTFSNQEMTTFGRTGQHYFFRARDDPSYGSDHGGGGIGRGRGRGRGRGCGGRGGRWVRAVDISHVPEDTSAITQGTQATGTPQTGTINSGTTTENGNRGATNGSRFGAGRRQGAVDSSTRRVGRMKSVNMTEPTDFRPRRNGIDSMADTCCGGTNWTSIQPTGKFCDVMPFKNGYDPTPDISVSTLATLVTDKHTGMDIILICNEMLDFGDGMEVSLINPNQIRHNGGRVQDDYTRSEDFGMHLDGKHLGHIFIPFKMQGTTVYFESRAPTWQEIKELPSVEMTSIEEWNPKDVQLRIHNTTVGKLVAKVDDSNMNQWSRLNYFEKHNGPHTHE
jgi:hypothetical protein